ncbi:MAG TPA: ATP-dependent zinc metalloprotease FtsH [Candidatus Paceibacterota bacterium]|nr:ATP-dependent zinc metalloprotease FtsH [Candidatus Paceibacterota bacterium]
MTEQNETSKHEKKRKGDDKRTPIPKMPVGPGNFWNNILTTVIFIIILSLVYAEFAGTAQKPEELSISQVAERVKGGEVKEIVVKGSTLDITYTDETRNTGVSKKENDAAITETLVNLGVTTEQIGKVAINVQNETGFRYWLSNLAPFLFPFLLLGFIVWFFSRSVKGAGMQALNFGSSKARMIDPNDQTQKVTFKDVAGAKEAKQELEEIVDFLKNPKKFLDIGAQIPKGVMMMGAPGTGKTLLARAVAGEAGVPFFSISGSEFVEMFVGVGASRVRDLFSMAKKAAPAIIFVDEIDAVGRVRGTGVGGGNDEREQTLNQILVEMDGFEPNQKVVVMAATNRPDVLDPALLRPGRFDRRVTIDLPDRDDRKAILAVHARKKPLQEDVNLDIIAQRTPGFSGADLYSLMNEGAILAARENRKKVGQFDLIRSIEKVLLGPERKSHVLSRREREITAYHEAGHALVASVLPYADPVQKISIISRGRAAGYTLKLPDEDRRMASKKEFLDDIAMTLGGYVTEQMIFDDLTTGPSNDLQVIANLARDMVTKYGMSETLGPVALEGTGGRMIGGGMSEDRGYSHEIAKAIDDEVRALIEGGKSRAREILMKYRDALDAVAHRLLEVETLEREEYEGILKAHGVDIQDAYKEMREKEERIGDPSRSLEPATDTLAGV